MTDLEMKLAKIQSEKDTKIIPANIKKDVQIFDITGTLESLDTSDATATAADILATKTAYVNGEKIIGSMTNYDAQVVTPTTERQIFNGGYYPSFLVEGVDNSIDENIVAGNIKSGVSILGVTGTYSGGIKEYSSETAMNNDIANIENGEVVKILQKQILTQKLYYNDLPTAVVNAMKNFEHFYDDNYVVIGWSNYHTNPIKYSFTLVDNSNNTITNCSLSSDRITIVSNATDHAFTYDRIVVNTDGTIESSSLNQTFSRYWEDYYEDRKLTPDNYYFRNLILNNTGDKLDDSKFVCQYFIKENNTMIELYKANAVISPEETSQAQNQISDLFGEEETN